MSFRLAIEKSISSGITEVDDAGNQVYVNKSLCKMLVGARTNFWENIRLMYIGGSQELKT